MSCERHKAQPVLIYSDCPGCEIERITRERNALQAQCDAYESELERERMRLAACSVIALANTRDSARTARSDIPSCYDSASLHDVIASVDREMALREERDDLRARCEAGAKAWDELQTEMAKVRQISDHNAQALARALMELWELRGQKEQ